MKVRLLTKTVGAINTEYENKSTDEIIVGIARLSSSREMNELFQDPHKLLRHCLSNNHWSVFDTVNLGFEIKTSRAVGREILRHEFKKQEFSQRYASVSTYEEVEIRKQSANNRQSSVEIIDDSTESQILIRESVDEHLQLTKNIYKHLLENEVARECARMILPECAETTLYINGSIRLYISFLNQRLHKTAQKECRLVAEAIRDIFIQECPIISEMLFNFEEAYDCHILDRVLLEKYGVYQAVKTNGYKKLAAS